MASPFVINAATGKSMSVIPNKSTIKSCPRTWKKINRKNSPLVPLHAISFQLIFFEKNSLTLSHTSFLRSHHLSNFLKVLKGMDMIPRFFATVQNLRRKNEWWQTVLISNHFIPNCRARLTYSGWPRP